MGKYRSKHSSELHDFYCINCGNKGISLMRKQSLLHAGMHRKKLYCIHCKCEVNHVECKTCEEVESFKEDFNNGLYKEEAQESLKFLMMGK